MNRIRVRLVVLATAVGALWGGQAAASGTIVTTGATIAAGTAPTPGKVTIDRCVAQVTAPVLPDIAPLDAIGAMTGALPAFSGGGDGGLGPFTATTSSTLPAGTYEYSTFTVNAGATITCLGPVTIRTTGAMTLNGALFSSIPSAPITVACGGDLSINNSGTGALGTVIARIETQGVSSPVVVDVGGNISLSSTVNGKGAGILATDGDLDVTAQGGMNFYASASVVASSLVQTQRGDMRVRCGLDLFTGSALVNAFAGSVLLQSFGGDVLLGGASASGNVLAIGGGVRIEASHAAIASKGICEAHGGDLSFHAFGGSITVQNGWSFDLYGAALTVGASAGVVVLDTAGIRGHGSSAVAVTAFGGGVRLGDVGTAQTPEIVQVSSGQVDVRASGDVVLNGKSRIVTPSGGLSIASVAGNLRQEGDTAVTATGGPLDVRVAGSIVATRNTATGVSKPAFAGETVTLRAGAGGMALDVDQVAAASGDCSIVSGGAILVSGPVTAAGALTVRSIDGGIAVNGQSLTTSSTGAGSGDVVVESYAGAKGVIDATNAIVRSGNDSAKSGDVTVVIYMSNPGPVDGYLLPTSVAITLDGTGDASKSVLAVSGVLDTGAAVADLSGAGTLQVGTITTAVNLVAGANGALRSKDASHDFQILPSKSGSSKARFTLKSTGDFGALAGSKGAGTLQLRFTDAAVDCVGAVVLTAGKYASGKRRGAVAAPNLVPLAVKATLSGNKRDAITAKFGFATDGTTPVAAPDVTVSFGDTFRLTAPASKFGASPVGTFVARRPAPGVSSVTLDYRHETVTIVGSFIRAVAAVPGTPGRPGTPGSPLVPFDLGPFPAGSSIEVTAGVTVGTDARAVKVRMSRKGRTLSY